MINPLTDKSKPYVVIRFIHSDNKEHSFRSEVNRLTGHRLSGFDHTCPSLHDTVAWVKSVVKDIRAKSSKILAFECSKQFIKG